ncbi:MAG: SPASM domain-containing protein [Oligoflexia bacterium]|nr:SPASM domain-containing protein [Oligoflexia bacterium]
MKCSSYNKYIQKDDKLFIYNYFTGSIVEIENINHFNALKNNDLNSISEQLKANLEDQGIIIDKQFNETNELKFSNLLARYSSDTLGLTIVNTLKCNFKCPYCYESRSNPSSMSIEIQNAVIDFVKNKWKESKFSNLFITFLGGEVFKDVGSIDYIMDNISKAQTEYNFNLSCSLITNGFEIDRYLDRLDRWMIKDVQITFDGDETNHNITRYDKNNTPSFHKIFSNMLLLLDKNIDLAIRLNLTTENIEDGYLFIDRLNKLDKKPYLYFGHVKNYGNSCNSGNCLSRSDFSNVHYKLTAYAVKNEVPCSILPNLHWNHCVADTINGYVIDPDGYLYKCWHYVGKKERSFANVKEYQKITNKENFYRFLIDENYLTDDGCKKCECLPICMGACPMERHDLGNKNCTHFKYNAEKYIELYCEQKV